MPNTHPSRRRRLAGRLAVTMLSLCIAAISVPIPAVLAQGGISGNFLDLLDYPDGVDIVPTNGTETVILTVDGTRTSEETTATVNATITVVIEQSGGSASATHSVRGKGTWVTVRDGERDVMTVTWTANGKSRGPGDFARLRASSKLGLAYFQAGYGIGNGVEIGEVKVHTDLKSSDGTGTSYDGTCMAEGRIPNYSSARSPMPPRRPPVRPRGPTWACPDR